MYLIEKLQKTHTVFGQRWEWVPDLLVKADHVEVWGSQFSDPGPDLCVARLVSPSGEILAEVPMQGY